MGCKEGPGSRAVSRGGVGGGVQELYWGHGGGCPIQGRLNAAELPSSLEFTAACPDAVCSLEQTGGLESAISKT